MSLGQFFAILRARWMIIVLALLLALGTAAALNLLLPKKYSAAASVLLDVKTPDPISGGISPGMMSPAYMATQVDVIQSDRVAQKVVRGLRLAENPATRSQWMEATGGAGSYERWLADLVQGSLEVKPSRESNVISIAYKSVDPKFAAALANAFAQAYVDVTLEMRVEPARQYTGFFDARAKQLREAVEQAQGRLSAFQKDKGIIAVDERLDVETARLNELSSQLVALQALSAETGSRQAQVRGSGDQLSDVLNNPLVGSLKADVSRQEARLQELNARLGARHPQVLEQEASLEALRARLATETRRVTGSIGVNNTITRAREAEVRAALEAQRARVLKLKEQRDELAVLQHDVEQQQRAYDTISARATQSNLESQASQTNVAQLSPATEPMLPSSPRLLLNTALSIFVGALLGVATALLRELLDRRVRSAQDLVQSLDLPVLGVMLRPSRGLFEARRQKRLLHRRLLGQPPRPRST